MLEKFLNKTSFSSQEDFMQNFKVKVPENFNFGYDVVDEWARIQPDKKLYVGQMTKGNTSTLPLQILNGKVIKRPHISSL